MNAVEIEEAVSLLAEQAFDPQGFPFAFLEAFGNKKATLDRLKKGNTNVSDIEGGVLQRNNIHIVVCAEGATGNTLATLKSSSATTKGKVKLVLATDGNQSDRAAEPSLCAAFERQPGLGCGQPSARYESLPGYFWLHDSGGSR